MSDEDPAYARKLQSNSGRARALDGGAVAAGLCFGVLAIFVSIAGPLTTEVRLAFTTLCLLCGGVTAGYLTRPDASGALQGAVVTLCTAGLMAAVSISVSVGEGSLFRVPLVLVYETLSTVGFGALLALSVCFGALAGALGTRIRH
jgi:hypothetical protein